MKRKISRLPPLKTPGHQEFNLYSAVGKFVADAQSRPDGVGERFNRMIKNRIMGREG